ncbi:AAA family ATPase, partial [Acidaminococcus intestini]|uniref:AAA family ATPase n=1 Tax=Acidaminococcus intestini TaxID=187327 RepID=UPI00307B072A
TNKTAAIVKEWADALLFANYKTIIMTDQTTNKKKGVGGKRVMYTQHASTWDAKNRWCLPPEVPFEYASIAPYIPDLGEPPVVIDSPQGSVPLPPDPSPEEEAFWDVQDNPAEASGPAPQSEVIATAAQVAAADPKQAVIKQVFDLLKTEGMTETDVRRAVAARGYYPEETSIMDYDIEFLKGVILGAWPQLKSFIVANKI